MSGSSRLRITRLKVLKRDVSVQPFDKNKLITSIKKTGATNRQAELVVNQVLNLLGDRQTVCSSQLATLVAYSLSKVNPTALSKYTRFSIDGISVPKLDNATFAKLVEEALARKPEFSNEWTDYNTGP